MKRTHAGKRPTKVAAALGAVLVTAGCATVATPVAPSTERSSRNDGGVEQLLLYCGKLRADGELTTAASICERAYKLDQTDPRPLLMLGAILTDLERLPQAAQVYQTLLEQTPSNTEARYQLGKTHIAMGHHDVALSELRLALSQNPNDARLYNAIGIAHGMLGSQEAARESFEKGLAVAPGDVPLRNNLGLSLVLNGRYAEGIAILEAVVADPAANATSYRNLQLAQGMAQNANGSTAVAATPTGPQVASTIGGTGYIAEPMLVMPTQGPQIEARIEAPIPQPQIVQATPPSMPTEPVMLTDALAPKGGAGQIAKAEPPAFTDDTGAGDDTGFDYNTDSAEPDAAESGEAADAATDEAGAEAESSDSQVADAQSSDTAVAPAPADAPEDSAPEDADASDEPYPQPMARNDAIALAPAPAPASSPHRAQVASLGGGGYSVQLASFRSADGAVAGWRQIRASASDLLQDVKPVIRRSDLGPERGVFYRLRTKATTKSAATGLCEALKARKIGCLTVKEDPTVSDEIPMPEPAKS